MAGPNLKTMDVDALLKLRAEIETHLTSRRRELEHQLARLATLEKAKDGRGPRAKGESNAGKGKGRRGAHPLKGKKRPVKYRDPATGAAWAGVGMAPRWIVDYEAQGRSREDFATGEAIPQKAKSAVKKSRGRKKAA